ncbi:MAG: M14 metallopeptidase family protein [Bacteroidales bacterium]
MKKFIFTFLLGLSCFLVKAQDSSGIPSPEAWFGFQPGTDKALFDYDQMIAYLRKVDEASPRMSMQEIGESPMGRKMFLVFISSPENISGLAEYKEVNRKLALDWSMKDDERDKLVEQGKVFMLLTLSMHSEEVGPTQAFPLILYDLVTTQDPIRRQWLDQVVLMVVPNHNPDGMQMVVDHYRKYKGSIYEGSSLPGVYHKYVGHDNNRDFVALTQKDTRAIAAIYNTQWYPQVMMEKHQMGATGVRYFVPPAHDPIADNVDEGIWNWTWVFGSNLARDMTANGCSGVAQHYLFDDYWPGSTETAIWKNMIGMLTECASANIATPVYVEKNELRVGGKGLGEYKKSINMPLPWPGGWWRLGDIVKYEQESTWSLLATASANRKEILRFRNDLCRKEVNKGKTQAPAYYVLPSNQHDPGALVACVNLLLEHGIACYRLEGALQCQNSILPDGSIIVPLAQAYRSFIKEVMEKQVFPARHYTPGGELIRPYDITSWSIPLHNGLKVNSIESFYPALDLAMKPITAPFTLRKPTDSWSNSSDCILSANNNESYKAAFKALSLGITVMRVLNNIVVDSLQIPAGSFVLQPISQDQWNNISKELTVDVSWIPTGKLAGSKILSMPRIGILESWFHEMDAGWTRFIFDEYHIPYTLVRPSELAMPGYQMKFDVLVIPDQEKTVLMEGKYKSGDQYYIADYPPEYMKGMGKDGFQKVLKFLNDGGTVLSWGSSVGLFTGNLELKTSATDKEEFSLPFTDISGDLRKAGLDCPGSLLRVELKKDHPLTWGMSTDAGVFARGEPVFRTSVPGFDMDRRVIATFPEDNILLSGYCEKSEKLAGLPSMLWIRKGKGELVLYGFNPGFRASTSGVYKLMLNGLLLGKNTPQLGNF